MNDDRKYKHARAHIGGLVAVGIFFLLYLGAADFKSLPTQAERAFQLFAFFVAGWLPVQMIEKIVSDSDYKTAFRYTAAFITVMLLFSVIQQQLTFIPQYLLSLLGCYIGYKWPYKNQTKT